MSQKLPGALHSFNEKRVHHCASHLHRYLQGSLVNTGDPHWILHVVKRTWWLLHSISPVVTIDANVDHMRTG